MKRFWLILILLFIACDKSEPLDDACYLTPDPGVCLALFPRYYYDDDAEVWFHSKLWKNVQVVAVDN